MSDLRSTRSYDMGRREDWEAGRENLARLSETDPAAADDVFVSLMREAGEDINRIRNVLGTGYRPVGGVAASEFVRGALILKDIFPSALEQAIVFAFRLRRPDLALQLIDIALSKKPTPLLLSKILDTVIKYERDDDVAVKVCSKIAQYDPYRVGTLTYQAQLATRSQARAILSKAPPITRGVLATFGPGEHLSLLDGGATASSVEEQFADWPADTWRVYGFDPHPDADLSINKASNVQMIRTALGRSPGEIRLYHTATDGASSVYEPNIDYLRHLFHGLDTPLIEKMAVTSESVVKVTDLDTWRETASVPYFDFMKLNVQGAELEILEGAPDTLRNCLGIQCEVALAPIYQDAPVFRDVDGFLDKAGFTFFDMRKPTTSGRLTKRNTPFMGSRVGQFRWPSRQITEAQMLYLRDPFRPEEQAASRWEDPKTWLRLAVIAEMNGQVDFAMQLCETVLESFPSHFPDNGVAFSASLDAASNFYLDFNHRNS